MAQVLCTGVDRVLMETRKLVLQHAGHNVVGVMDARDLVAICQRHQFDIAVIGQAMSSKSKKAIAALIREHCPSVRILELYPEYQAKTLDDADSWLEVPADKPEALAKRVNELAAQKSKDAIA